MSKVYSYTYNVLKHGNILLSCHGVVEIDDFIQSKEEYLQIMRGETLRIRKEHPDYQIVFTSPLSLLNPEKIKHRVSLHHEVPPPKEVSEVEPPRGFWSKLYWGEWG